MAANVVPVVEEPARLDEQAGPIDPHGSQDRAAASRSQRRCIHIGRPFDPAERTATPLEEGLTALGKGGIAFAVRPAPSDTKMRRIGQRTTQNSMATRGPALRIGHLIPRHAASSRNAADTVLRDARPA